MKKLWIYRPIIKKLVSQLSAESIIAIPLLQAQIRSTALGTIKIIEGVGAFQWKNLLVSSNSKMSYF
jgi:hypothetical protein